MSCFFFQNWLVLFPATTSCQARMQMIFLIKVSLSSVNGIFSWSCLFVVPSQFCGHLEMLSCGTCISLLLSCCALPYHLELVELLMSPSVKMLLSVCSKFAP